MNWNLQEAVEYYRRQGAPSDQAALLSLLREAQQENGGSLTEALLQEIKFFCGLRLDTQTRQCYNKSRNFALCRRRYGTRRAEYDV